MDGPIGPLLEELGVSVVFGPNVESIKQPIKFGLSLFSLSKNLLKFVKDKNIHTIHSHNAQSDKLAVFDGKLSGVPAFPTIHNTLFMVDIRSKLDPRGYLIKAVDQVIYRIAEQVLAVSVEVKEVLCCRYNLDASKVVVVRNGIFLDPSLERTLRKNVRYSQHKGKLKLLAVGRLTHQKNFLVLIIAIDYLVKGGCKDISVHIAGNGEEYDRLFALISDLHLESYVELLGVRSDVLELMQEADLFVMPSRYEGLSIAMIEALACGLPVIASDAPGLRDFIIHHKNGMLFPVGDYNALAKCILGVFEDRNLLVNLSKGAKKSYLQHYDMKENIAPFLKMLSDYKTK